MYVCMSMRLTPVERDEGEYQVMTVKLTAKFNPSQSQKEPLGS